MRTKNHLFSFIVVFIKSNHVHTNTQLYFDIRDKSMAESTTSTNDSDCYNWNCSSFSSFGSPISIVFYVLYQNEQCQLKILYFSLSSFNSFNCFSLTVLNCWTHYIRTKTIWCSLSVFSSVLPMYSVQCELVSQSLFPDVVFIYVSHSQTNSQCKRNKCIWTPVVNS